MRKKVARLIGEESSLAIPHTEEVTVMVKDKD